MLKVGVTGGIGSGKSTVCSIFKVLGIPVYDADTNAKTLINTSQKLRNAITELLGKESFLPSGYNTKYVASKVFDNPEMLNKLNRIIHPFIADDFTKWTDKQSNAPYIIEEAAILFESGAYRKMDRTIMVDAPLELRIDRIVKRDNASRENILKRIQNQWPAEKIRELTDWVIANNDHDLILPQVLAIHNELLKSI